MDPNKLNRVINDIVERREADPVQAILNGLTNQDLIRQYIRLGFRDVLPIGPAGLIADLGLEQAIRAYEQLATPNDYREIARKVWTLYERSYGDDDDEGEGP